MKNPLKSRVCIGCGIYFNEFQEGKAAFYEIKANQIKEKAIKLEKEISSAQKTEEVTEKKSFRRKILYISISGSLLGLIVIIFFSYLGKQFNIREEKALEHYELAQTCFSNEDYFCARENLDIAVKKGYSTIELDKFSMQIFEKLASVYFVDYQFSSAQVNAEKCLKIMPYNTACREIFCRSSVDLAKQYMDDEKWQETIDILNNIFQLCSDF
ncbi:MAG: hypothetical protein AB2L18_09055 [Anaerolineaceae bacterium]